MDVYFNAEQLPEPVNEYVAFIDIMGIKSHMRVSVKQTANFIFKLHAAIISAKASKVYRDVSVYPVMDGAYITARTKRSMTSILYRIYFQLAEIFLQEKENLHLFLLRGAIAYGEVIHGHHVPFSSSYVFEMDKNYKNNILLGHAMISAYENEKNAAPFGVFIHESAVNIRNSKTTSFNTDWKWFKMSSNNKTLVHELKRKIICYFNSLKDENHPLHYDQNKINNHVSEGELYFG